MKARLGIQDEDGFLVTPNGSVMLETSGLSEDLRLLRSVMKAIREGRELFPGQQSIAPMVTELFKQPLQVFLVGEFKTMTAGPAPAEEIHKCELAKPTEAVLTAVAAIRALTADL